MVSRGIDRASCVQLDRKCCTGNASHAWRRIGPGLARPVARRKKVARSGRWMEGGQGRRWTRGEHGAARENKIKEGNRWQFFTSFLKRGLGTRGESLNRFFRRAPFFSRLLVRQPTRALPTYLPTHLSNHHLCSQLFRRRNSGNVTSKFGFQIQVHDLTELAPHGFSCQTNACRGYARISEIKSGYHQMSEFKRALLFYFSLSLSLFFSSFLFSFHFFFATVSLSFPPLFDGVVPICMKNTIPRSNTRTRPRRYGCIIRD